MASFQKAYKDQLCTKVLYKFYIDIELMTHKKKSQIRIFLSMIFQVDTLQDFENTMWSILFKMLILPFYH